jgi:hypothetical protein
VIIFLFFDIQDYASALKTRIESLKNIALPGGWEETFLKLCISDSSKFEENNDGTYYSLNGISLYKTCTTQHR